MKVLSLHPTTKDMMQTRKEKIQDAIKANDLKKAFKLASKSDYTYTKDEMRVLSIAHECLTGKETFYQQIGVDIPEIKDKAVKLLEKIK